MRFDIRRASLMVSLNLSVAVAYYISVVMKNFLSYFNIMVFMKMFFNAALVGVGLKTAKKLENIKQKILNAKWSKIFNEICIKESLLPNYTSIYFFVEELVNRNLYF